MHLRLQFHQTPLYVLSLVFLPAIALIATLFRRQRSVAPAGGTQVKSSPEVLLRSVLSEYNSLRSEIDTASANLYAASWQGALALGAILLAGATVLGESKSAAAVIFGAGALTTASFFIVLWAEEVFVIIRIGEYVRNFIEPKVHSIVGNVEDFELPDKLKKDPKFGWDSPMTFELYLRSSLHRWQFRWFQRTHYRVTHLFFYIVGLGGLALSGTLIFQAEWNVWLYGLPGVGVAVLTVVWGKYFYEVKKMMAGHYASD